MRSVSRADLIELQTDADQIAQAAEGALKEVGDRVIAVADTALLASALKDIAEQAGRLAAALDACNWQDTSCPAHGG